MKTLTILCGLPACGKSTWRNKNVKEETVISSDDLIEEEAKKHGITYDEAFEDNIKWADKFVKGHFEMSLGKGVDIIVDRTNLTPKARRYWINLAKAKGYKIKAVWFAPPQNNEQLQEWVERLSSREGKTIPVHVLENMTKTFEQPMLEEGFDEVSGYNSFEKKLSNVS